MAIHWQIPFRSLRANTLYTVNIYDSTYTGNPIVLKGGAQPFTTQEDDNEDIFENIRTQTGYIRFVDDGKDADGNVLSSTNDWKAMLPETDTDRPVTLTGVDAQGNSLGVVWQGFIQAQNFGGTLYGNPQEREFPVQCPLSVLSSSDVDSNNRSLQNFAYIIKHAFDSIPGITIDKYYFAGNTDALAWLQKVVDWQNLVEEDSEGNIVARYDNMTAIDDVCKFWGWSVRTYKTSVIFLKPDTNVTFRELTSQQMNTISVLSDSPDLSTGREVSFDTINLQGDIFASVNNDDRMVRGNNKATITANANTADEVIFEAYPEKVADALDESGDQYSEHEIVYTQDVRIFQTNYIEGSANEYASFNLCSIWDKPITPCIRIKKTSGHVLIQTLFAHGYYLPESHNSGILVQYKGIKFSGEIYSKGVKYNDFDNRGVSKGKFYIRVGIGKTYGSAMWYGDDLWGSTPSNIPVYIKQNGDFDPGIIPTNSPWLSGFLFFEIIGSDDMPLVDNEHKFDIMNFKITFKESVIEWGSFSDSEKKLSERSVYVSKNTSKVRNEWNSDIIYASENNLLRGYGIVLNNDGSRMEKASFSGVQAHPEQHLADRVTTYWAESKRQLSLELRSNAISEIAPYNKVNIDSQNFHPISINHEWRDDVTKLTILQV